MYTLKIRFMTIFSICQVNTYQDMNLCINQEYDN